MGKVGADYDSDDYDDEDEEEGVREVMRLVQRQNGRLIPASMRSTRAPPVSMRPVGTPRDSVSAVTAVTAAVSKGDARLEPYDTMVWKYSAFAVFVPGAEYAVFRGARGAERGRYETLRATPHAALARRSMRAGDLARTVRDLASYRFSTPGDGLWPDEMRRMADSDPRIPHGYPPVTSVMFEGDLDGELATILVVRGLKPHMLLVRAGVLSTEARSPHNMAQMAVFDIGAAALGTFRQVMNEVDRYVSEVADLHAAALAAPDKRLVCVTRMDCSNCEQALRFVHASLAVLAQKGVISGGSLVAINTRGCGPKPRKSEARKLVRCIERSPYAYGLQTIGTTGQLLLFRADAFVAPLLPHGTLRAAEIGAYSGGSVPRFRGSSEPRRGPRR